MVVNNKLENLLLPANVEAFESILGNLLINALESYPEGENNRKITIETELVESDTNRQIRIRVLDEGTGIDPNVKDHIFEPFISGKTSVGHGMGLTIARHGIRNLGGELLLKPRIDEGICAELSHPGVIPSHLKNPYPSLRDNPCPAINSASTASFEPS